MSSYCLKLAILSVIPVQTGIQYISWIPAYAGMTNVRYNDND